MPDKRRFAERELERYGEPASVRYIREGQVHFSVTYARGSQAPTMENLVYIERNVRFGDVDDLYFQDACSDHKGLRYNMDPEDERSTIEVCGDESN